MKTKKGDFVELDFTAKIKETGKIFDLTDENLAKKEKIHNPKAEYGSIIICIGEKQVIPGFDQALEDKELNKEYTEEVTPEKAFGKKDAKLFQLVNTNKFLKQKIRPFPGLRVNVDNFVGVIKTVSGGRTLVDFNHPLAGKTLIYTFTIKRIVKEDKEKLQAFLDRNLRKGIKFELKDNKATIDMKIDQTFEKPIKDKIKALIPSIKEIDFKTNTKA